MSIPERVFRVTPGTAFASGVTVSGTDVTFGRDGKLRISIAADKASILNMKENAVDQPFNSNAVLIGSNAVQTFETIVTKDDPITFNLNGIVGGGNVTLSRFIGHFFADE